MAAFHCFTFMTDYGLEDAFVAVCHGVAFQIAPDIRIIDITHLIPPGDIRRGAVVLAQAVPYFPPSVHVAVVDPGVGTARRAVAVEAGGSLFVGPDNGLLTAAVAAAGGATRAVALTNRSLWWDGVSPTGGYGVSPPRETAGPISSPLHRVRPGGYGGSPPRKITVSATFHGRDIFMPAAAWLASGTPLDHAGDLIDVTSLVTLPRPECLVTDGVAHVEVVTVDRFGNAQLSLTGAAAAEAGFVPGTTVMLAWDSYRPVDDPRTPEGEPDEKARTSGSQQITVPFGTTFGDVDPGGLICYCDSSGFIAVAVAGGDAARRLGLRAGTRMTLTATPPPA